MVIARQVIDATYLSRLSLVMLLGDMQIPFMPLALLSLVAASRK